MKTIVSEIPDHRTFMRGEKTLEIGYPWLTFGAIIELEKILKDSGCKFKVLEMGSGGSTLFFEKRCKRLISLEDSLEWAQKVWTCLTTKRVKIVHLIVSKLRRYIKRLPDNYFDIILADSCSGGNTYGRRLKMINLAIPKLKQGGWLIVDNYAKMDVDYSGFEVYTFDMIGYSGKGTRICKKT